MDEAKQKLSTINLLKQDAVNIILVSSLSTLMGAFQGFFIDAGAVKEQISPLSIISVPLTFKIIYSLVLDSCFLNELGQRKTFIITAGSLIFITSIVLAFFIEELIDHLRIKILILVGLLFYFYLGMIEISTDAWIASYFQKENICLGYSSKLIGFSLGVIFSLQVSNAIVFFSLAGVFQLLLTLLIAFKVEEKSVKDKSVSANYDTVAEIFSEQNYNFRFIMAISFIMNTGFLAAENELHKIQKQFQDDQSVLPFKFMIQIISGILLGILFQQTKRYLTVFGIGYLLRIGFGSLIVTLLFLEKPNLVQEYNHSLVMIQTLIIMLNYVPFCSFIYQISTKRSIAGTFITIFFFFISIGQMINTPNIIDLLLVIVNLKVFLIIGLIFALMLLILFFKGLRELEEIPLEQWKF